MVFIHPIYGCNDIRLNDYDIIKAVGQGLDTTTARVSMFYPGHLLGTPLCPWFRRRMGGLPGISGRLHYKYYHLSGSIRRSGKGVLAYCAAISDTDACNFLIAKADLERVMMGSGYSFPIGAHAPKGLCMQQDSARMLQSPLRQER